MNLNELKSTWENAGGSKKTQPELEGMTTIKNHPKVRQTKVKFAIESILLTLFLAGYYDALDGATKPLWLNITLITSIVLYVVNDIYGYLTLLNPVQGTNIAKSLERFKSKLQRILVGSMVTSIVFAISLILFLTINIHFTAGKYAVLTGLILTFGIMFYISYRTWISRIRDIRESVHGFTEGR